MPTSRKNPRTKPKGNDMFPVLLLAGGAGLFILGQSQSGSAQFKKPYDLDPGTSYPEPLPGSPLPPPEPGSSQLVAADVTEYFVSLIPTTPGGFYENVTGVQIPNNSATHISLGIGIRVQNFGTTTGAASIRLNLGLDSAFGDVSQLVIEDGSGRTERIEGALKFDVSALSRYAYMQIGPGLERVLRINVVIPVNRLWERQGSVTGFNWWIAEFTVNIAGRSGLVSGNSRFEIRDWFRLI